MKKALVAILSFMCFGSAFAQTRASGTIGDALGKPIAFAVLKCSDGKPLGTADDKGDFTITTSDCTSGTIVISAAGFEPLSLPAGKLIGEIILLPAIQRTTVTVTATRTAIEDTPASVRVLTSDTLSRSSGLTLDDRLRQVPGFTLFRRSGSRTANPTTQGVSLRGVGASGASRALVVKNGIPLNDPFGSWVYWGRVVNTAVAEVEVLRGVAGDIYGSSAIGGVIAVNSLSQPNVLSIDTSAGGETTGLFSLYGSKKKGRLRGSLASEILSTEGYIPVEKASRGLIDTPAGVRRSTVEPSIEFTTAGARLFGSAEFYREVRTNGTPLQTNDTHIDSYSAGADLAGRSGAILIRAFNTSENYHQSFSAIANDRNTEALNRLQTVPSKGAGLRIQWTLDKAEHTFYAGFDGQRVSGRSDEFGFAAGRATSRTSRGGTQLSLAGFAGFIWRKSNVVLNASGRFDRWRSGDGKLISQTLPNGNESVNALSSRTETNFSPHLGIVIHLHPQFSFTGSIGRSFREPTLNELYRSFRVGNVVTQSNPELVAERATGAETAVSFRTREDRAVLRIGPFCTWIDRPVSNVTVSITPTLINRRRANSGDVRTCGIEADGEFKPLRGLSLSAGYVHLEPVATAADGTRNLLPQTARDQFTFQASLTKDFGTLSAQIRASSGQFDDDLNLFRLNGFGTLDLFYSKSFRRRFEIYAAIENVTNSRIEAGRTPVVTLGQPRNARIGLRFRTPGR